MRPNPQWIWSHLLKKFLIENFIFCAEKGICNYPVVSHLTLKCFTLLPTTTVYQCVKSVRIRSYSGPYSLSMPENTDQNNSKYGHFSRSVFLLCYPT